MEQCSESQTGDPKEAKTEQPGLEMRYFILKPKGHSPHAKASRTAMEAYAFQIGEENPKLASELREWIRREVPTEGCGCGYCNT